MIATTTRTRSLARGVNLPLIPFLRSGGLSTSTAGSNNGPKSKVFVFGLAEDRNSSFLRGPANAPPLIKAEMISDAHNNFCELGPDVISRIEMMDDIAPELSDSNSISRSIDLRISSILEQKGFPLILGGDHSITYPICKTIRKYRDKPFIILHFDAHPDLYPNFEGNLSSHASPFIRILEERDNKNNVICKDLYQIGIRTINDVQRQMIEFHNVRVCEARYYPPSLAIPSIADYFRDIKSDDDVYISLDIDCLDPAFAPGVSHREPGGLTTRQLIDCIHAIPGNIIGADVVEYNPSRDFPGNYTATLAAKLVKEIAGKMIYQINR